MQKLELENGSNSDADESQVSDSDANLLDSETDSLQSTGNASCKKSQKSKVGRKSKKIKDSDSNLSFSSSDSDSDEKKKKKKHKKSGIKAKASDSVKFPQKYPQAFLRYEFVSSNVTLRNSI